MPKKTKKVKYDSENEKAKKKGKINIKNSNKVIVNIGNKKRTTTKMTKQQLPIKNGNHQLANSHSFIVSAPDRNQDIDNVRLKAELARTQDELNKTRNQKSSSTSSTNTETYLIHQGIHHQQFYQILAMVFQLLLVILQLHYLILLVILLLVLVS
jgi:hypothetical protein